MPRKITRILWFQRHVSSPNHQNTWSYPRGHLVGGWTTHLKNISQNGKLPQTGVNIKNNWNHHLVIVLPAPPKKMPALSIWSLKLTIQFLHQIWSVLRSPPRSQRSCPLIFPLHPGRLTWNLQITHLERKMIFQTSMIMFHVNLQGSNHFGCKLQVFHVTFPPWLSPKRFPSVSLPTRWSRWSLG